MWILLLHIHKLPAQENPNKFSTFFSSSKSSITILQSRKEKKEKNFTFQVTEETTTMVLISLPLVKIRGDAKADDDSDVGATIARKPLNAQLDCNIARPFFSANLNSSSPLSTDHRPLFKIPTNSFSSQTNWGTQNFPILRNNPKRLAYIWTVVVVVGACLHSIKTLVVSIKGFFLFLLENVIAEKTRSPETWCFFRG